jgi:Flp pilus assembly protein TadB
MGADERTTMSSSDAAASPFHKLAWIAGALATSVAVVVGAVLAVIFAATVVVVGLAAFAFRGRKVATSPAEDGLIEARNVGGHSWVAYGWNERR